jgi:hypothetical protein
MGQVKDMYGICFSDGREISAKSKRKT